MLSEKDIKYLERVCDERIVNENAINNPDRNIDDVVFDCYSNLKYGYLAAWSEEIADLDLQYTADFSTHLYKLSENKKGKTLSNTSVDVSNMRDSYKVLRLLYIVKPSLISDKFRYNSYQNTINRFEEFTSKYQNVVWDVKDKLISNFEKEKTGDNPIQEFKSENNSEALMTLFTVEQIVVLPMIDKTNKYIINDISYYSVYNNSENARITSNGEYFVKLQRNGIMGSHLIGEKNGVLYNRFYGSYVNPYILLSQGDLNTVTPESIIPWHEDKRVNDILEKTYLEALRDYNDKDNPERFQDEKRIKDNEKTFIREITESIYIFCEYITGIRSSVNTGERKFEQMATLKEEIYSIINSAMKGNNRGGERKMTPSIAVKRINLKPLQMLTLIKVGSGGQRSANRVFVSNTTDPSPLDIFHHFQYIKRNQHTQTNKMAPVKHNTSEENQYIKINDMEFLGQFAPKSAADQGAITMMHFGISDNNIKHRKDEK